MSVDNCTETINKIKDELSRQVNFWTCRLLDDKTLSTSLKQKIKTCIDKSNIMQKIRLKRAIFLLNKIKSSNNDIRGKEIADFQTFWAAVVPEIIFSLQLFKEINDSNMVQHNIDQLQIPQTFEIETYSKVEPEIDQPITE